MDEDQPATQPHLSPAEQAALEEARMKTADDSFVAGGQTPAPGANQPAGNEQKTLSTAKKVILSPVNDLSGYSAAPAIPRAVETDLGAGGQQPGAVTVPVAVNVSPPSPVAPTGPVVTAAPVAPSVTPAVSVSLPATPEQTYRIGQKMPLNEPEQSVTGRVAARVSMLQIAAVGGIGLFGFVLYLIYSVSHQYMSGTFFRLVSPILIPILVYMALFVYLLFTASVRRAMIVTIILLALIGQNLLVVGLSSFSSNGILFSGGRSWIVVVLQLIVFGALFVAYNELKDVDD